VNDRLSRLESEVQSLSRAIEGLEARLDSLEKSIGAQAGAGAPPLPTPAAPAPSVSEIASGMSFAGRTLLVLGGGYLLRALTESEALPPLLGVTLGLTYALLWLVAADRAGARTRTLSAAFHGAAAVLVAFPLLWETTSRFQLLSPAASAGCLALVSGVAVSVAWRRRLRSFAWVTVVGATLTSVALLVGTRDLVSFGLLLVLVGVATLWLAYHSDWPLVHWIVAGIADATVALLAVGLLIERTSARPAAALVVQLALFSLYLGSILYRLLKQGHEPGPFEMIQTGAVTLIGFGSALWTAPGSLGVVLGSLGLAAGAGSYALSFTSRKLTPACATYVSGVAFLLFLLSSTALRLEPTLLFALAGAGLSWFGSRFDKPIFCVHGSAFVLAAAISSGLLVQAAFAFLAPAEYSSPPVGLWLLVSFLAATFAFVLPAGLGESRSFLWWRLARLLDLGIAVLALGGIVLAAAAPWISGRPGEGADAANLATVRTTVLAASALALAALGRLERFREASWLVYPLLVAGGIKLVVEDFPQGRAATLFVGLALYGGALILAPRALRSSR
jgi:hypothetical protein